MFKRIKKFFKKFLRTISPAYRVSLRLEKKLTKIEERQIIAEKEIKKLNKSVSSLAEQNQWLFWMQQLEGNNSLTETQKNFWDRFPSADGDIRFVQLGTKYLLENLKKLCDQYGVQVFLQEGTLLGAIRHAGFIPWDDDVDVGMLRADFIKLKKCIQDNERFKIDICYNFGYKCKMAKFKMKSDEVPCFVDIFLYDLYECEDPQTCWDEISAVRKDFMKEFSENKGAFSEMYNDIPIKNEADLNLIEGMYKKQWDRLNVERNQGNIVYWAIENYRVSTLMRAYRYEDFFPLKECVYEGTVYNIPANTEDILKARYGNYLLVPSDVMRQRHSRKYIKDIEQIKEFVEKHIIEGDI